MRLRDYQTKATRGIEAEWKAGHRAVLLVMPPNAGKTVVFLHVIRKALKRGERVCVVAPNVVLTQQTIDKFSHIDHGIIWAGHTTGEDKQLQIASAPTLANRLDEYEFDLIVVDEAHHAAANTWKRILEQYSSARVLGVTATAKRLDGKGLDACGFTGLVRGPWIDSLTPQYMTPYRMWAPNVPELLDAPEGSDYKAADLAKHGIEMGVLIGDAVKHYTKHCHGKRALAFCMSIEDSKATVRRFIRAGYKAAHMDGNTPHEERRVLLDALNARRLDLISSCNVLGEGLDIPGVDVVIQLRPTRSYQMWLQQLGRGFRLDAQNPDKLLDVIDCAGNYFRFWSPSVDRGYGLDGAPSLDVERQQTQRRCDSCGLVYLADGHGYCPECHAKTAAAAAADTERRAVWRDGELVQVGGGRRGLVFPNPIFSPLFNWGRFVFKVNGFAAYLGTTKNELDARENFANYTISRNEAGRDPIDRDEAYRWMKKDRLKKLVFPKASGGSFTVRVGNIPVYLGKENNEENARNAFEKLVASREENGRDPFDKEEAYGWCGKRHYGLRPIDFPTPYSNGKYYIKYRFGAVTIGSISDESSARKVFDQFKENRLAANREPKDPDELILWCGKKRLRSVNFPPRTSGSFLLHCGGFFISLGSDESVAKKRYKSFVSKRESMNRNAASKEEMMQWAGIDQKTYGLKPAKLQWSKQRNGKKSYATSKHTNGAFLKAQLGSDPAIAQARVDQANARWEANGYKWPDTAEEFREWLTLPPRS